MQSEKDRAELALEAGKRLVEYVRKNKERFEGVIPYVERVNWYMQVILDELEKVSRPSTIFRTYGVNKVAPVPSSGATGQAKAQR